MLAGPARVPGARARRALRHYSDRPATEVTASYGPCRRTDTHRAALPERLRQPLRHRGAAGRAAGGPQLAAALRLRAVRRAVLRHRLHRAARTPTGAAGCTASGRPRVHGSFRALDDRRASRSRFDEVPAAPNQLRWSPLPIPDARRPISSMGSSPWAATARPDRTAAAASTGTSPTARCSDRFFYDADGELLIVPQQGRLRLATELGVLERRAAARSPCIPRGLRFRVELPDGAARGYVCENFGAPLRLPDLGPIGCQRAGQSARLPHPGRLRTRTATASSSWWRSSAGRSVVGAASITRRSTWSPGTATTRPTSTTCAASTPSARSASTTPTRRSSWCCSRRAIRPASTTSTSSIFPPRWLAMQDTFRPPWFHRNVASEFMGLIHGVYDAKAEGFVPGGASLHNCMSGHGPDAATFEQGERAPIPPDRRTSRTHGVHVRDAHRDPPDAATRCRARCCRRTTARCGRA